MALSGCGILWIICDSFWAENPAASLRNQEKEYYNAFKGMSLSR